MRGQLFSDANSVFVQAAYWSLVNKKNKNKKLGQVHTGLYPVENIVHIRTHFTKLWSNAILGLEQESSPVAVNVLVH